MYGIRVIVTPSQLWLLWLLCLIHGYQGNSIRSMVTVVPRIKLTFYDGERKQPTRAAMVKFRPRDHPSHDIITDINSCNIRHGCRATTTHIVHGNRNASHGNRLTACGQLRSRKSLPMIQSSQVHGCRGYNSLSQLKSSSMSSAMLVWW